jgi:hypothetical protein
MKAAELTETQQQARDFLNANAQLERVSTSTVVFGGLPYDEAQRQLINLVWEAGIGVSDHYPVPGYDNTRVAYRRNEKDQLVLFGEGSLDAVSDLGLQLPEMEQQPKIARGR